MQKSLNEPAHEILVLFAMLNNKLSGEAKQMHPHDRAFVGLIKCLKYSMNCLSLYIFPNFLKDRHHFDIINVTLINIYFQPRLKREELNKMTKKSPKLNSQPNYILEKELCKNWNLLLLVQKLK